MIKVDRHTGSSFDSFLEEEGILEEVDAVAIKRVIAWQLKREMDAQHISKKAMAERLDTSRSQVDRLLDPANAAVHLTTITRAARVLGLRLKIAVERATEADKSDVEVLGVASAAAPNSEAV
ncbi:MAG: Fis family transcriptional regulator [Methylocella sp.]